MVYALTKYMQEKMVLKSCKGIGVDAAALRFQNVYGPGQSLSIPTPEFFLISPPA
jgi:dTDP-L-rhamnose 4-epimerase